MKAVKRFVVCGIGNRLRSDDAVGPMVIERLRAKRFPETVLLVDCGSTPEGFSRKITEFEPDTVIIVDAVEMDRMAGDIDEIPLEKVKQQMATTHKMPITMFIEYLERRLPNAEIVFFGVQKASTTFGEKTSPEVELAVGKAAELVANMLSS